MIGLGKFITIADENVVKHILDQQANFVVGVAGKSDLIPCGHAGIHAAERQCHT